MPSKAFSFSRCAYPLGLFPCDVMFSDDLVVNAEEILCAFQKFGYNKSCGPDHIYVEHLNNAGIHKKSRRIEANLEPLNSVEGQERPLFIVHPITGLVSLLKPLGQALSVPCFGIKMTNDTPKTSITEMASFYVSEVEAACPKGPYRLAGYSLGTSIALEMALQLQAKNRMVECLILLDGSPDYIHAHGDFISKLEVSNNVGFLLSFIEMYIPKCKDSKAELRSSLMKLRDPESRLEWSVDYVLATIAIRSPAKVLRVARDFLNNCHIGHVYMPDKRYFGCIHLMRIKDAPKNAFPLPDDYGVSRLGDDLSICYYNGNHQSFLNDAKLAVDINKILKNLSR